MVTKGRNGDFSEDPKLKTYIACLFKKTGILDASGKLQVDVLKQKLSQEFKPEEIDKVVAKCNLEKATVDEFVSEFYKCYWASSDKHIALY